MQDAEDTAVSPTRMLCVVLTKLQVRSRGGREERSVGCGMALEDQLESGPHRNPSARGVLRHSPPAEMRSDGPVKEEWAACIGIGKRPSFRVVSQNTLARVPVLAVPIGASPPNPRGHATIKGVSATQFRLPPLPAAPSGRPPPHARGLPSPDLGPRPRATWLPLGPGP